jgi:hypothetical protein
MSKLVYIKEIFPDTYLHFSARGESFTLRDYFHATGGKPIEVLRPKEETAATIQRMAQQPGNRLIDPPDDKPLDDFDHWKKTITKLNQSLSPTMPSEGKSWIKTWTREIIIGVIIVVLGAIIVTWLGIKQ